MGHLLVARILSPVLLQDLIWTPQVEPEVEPMKHPWCKAIIPTVDQEIIEVSMHRLTLSLLMMSAVVSHLPEYLDAKFGNVEGS